MCDIFKSCITLGMLPNLLKLAKIVTLFKSKNSKLIKNYRPISLFHLLSKLIEKMFKSRTSKFIADNNILYRNQFGFRSGCTTSDALPKVQWYNFGSLYHSLAYSPRQQTVGSFLKSTGHLISMKI